MAIIIKNNTQIQKIRTACKIVKETFEVLEPMVKPGITTREIDAAAAKFLNKNGARPSFKNYQKYPKSICISINDEVVHGIPGIRRLKEGDIVSIDIGAFVGGVHGDAARTFACGKISKEAQHLIDVTKQAFFEAMKYARSGCFVSDISKCIQHYGESNGCSIVRELIGHGVGLQLHEEPEIPNWWGVKKRGSKLLPGMTLAIEPIFNAGAQEVDTLTDDWTVVTSDGSWSAHYENTVLITESEPEILTL